MTLPLASLSQFAGPDLVVLALIFIVLIGIPAAIAIPIVFVLNSRRKKPPSVATELQPRKSDP